MAAHPGDKPGDEERESIKEKHSQLTKELLEVRSKVRHLEKEIKAVQQEILEAGYKFSVSFLLKQYILFEGCNVGNNFKHFLNNNWSLGKLFSFAAARAEVMQHSPSQSCVTSA